MMPRSTRSSSAARSRRGTCVRGTPPPTSRPGRARRSERSYESPHSGGPKRPGQTEGPGSDPGGRDGRAPQGQISRAPSGDHARVARCPTRLRRRHARTGSPPRRAPRAPSRGASGPGRFTAVVIGAGFTGIEIATELVARMRALVSDPDRVLVVLVDCGPVVRPRPLRHRAGSRTGRCSRRLRVGPGRATRRAPSQVRQDARSSRAASTTRNNAPALYAQALPIGHPALFPPPLAQTAG